MADRPEFVTINSVELALDGCWALVDPTPLLSRGPARGRDRVIPGTAGEAYRARTLGAIEIPVVLNVWGFKDRLGTPYANIRDGIKGNLDYLYTQLPADVVGSVTCTYTHPDLTTRTGSVAVVEMMVSGTNPVGYVQPVGLLIKLLDGELT